jgi:CHAT domain-containing protein/predicted negative regulator of RcsB-dependent stress response
MDALRMATPSRFISSFAVHIGEFFMFSRSPRSSLSILLAIALAAVTLVPVNAAADSAATTAQRSNAATTQALATFRQGQALLRRNHADQALPLFEAALKQFTDAGDQVGAAAAYDALGDIYLRQGQYEPAITNYKTAADWYHAWGETANADLMFAKLGETYYLDGRNEEAQAAFAQISRPDGKSNTSGTNGRDGRNNNAGGAVTFASISAALLPGLACEALRGNRPGTPSSGGPNVPTSIGNSSAPTGPTNMGHAPQGPDGLGRMDLRVTDEQGNPIKDVDARLTSNRANGFVCDCTNSTDPTGRAVMNPLHVGPDLKLELKAPNYPSQTIKVNPPDLAQPYHVVLRKSGGALVLPAGAAQTVANTLPNVNNNTPSVSAPRACFDAYALYISYVTAEFGMGRINYERGDLNAAQAHFQNILAASDDGAPTANLLAARLYRAVARTSLGDIALAQGRYADAVKLYEQAARTAQTDNRLELAWAAERGIGHSKWLQAMTARDPQAAFRLRDDARRSYRAALDHIETLFAGSLRADDARTSFLARTKDVFDEALMVSAEMSMTAAQQGQIATGRTAHAADPAAAPLSGPALAYAVEAFRIAEEGRARSLLDLLAESHAEITAGVPPELLQRRADNLARQQEIADLLAGVGATNSAPEQSITKLEAELDRLSVEAQSLENQVRVASPRYNTLTRVAPLTLAEVQTQVLDNDTVLLEYNLGREQSYLWAVTKNQGLTLYRLPANRDIEQQVTVLRDQQIPVGPRRSILDLADANQRGLTLGGPLVAPQNVKAFADASFALYRNIVAPAASIITNKRLLVVPDGALNFVPFESLVSAAGGLEFASLPYLVQTNEIVYAPSASVVAAIRQQKAAAHGSGQGVLLVADPVFDPSDPRAQTSGTTMRSGAGQLALSSAIGDVLSLKLAGLKLARLIGTRTEAERIAELARARGMRADTWLDLDASEGNVERRDLSNYRMLHFATHGLLDTERPQFTGLVLAPAGEVDGFLRVNEVFNLRLGSPLVILSACETGLGKEKRGEGVIGLTRAFMYAGAPVVGVTLWSVADKSTAELMPAFYQHLLAEQAANAPAALRAAQLQMIAGRHYSAPYYWAPFVIIGDWK